VPPLRALRCFIRALASVSGSSASMGLKRGKNAGCRPGPLVRLPGGRPAGCSSASSASRSAPAAPAPFSEGFASRRPRTAGPEPAIESVPALRRPDLPPVQAYARGSADAALAVAGDSAARSRAVDVSQDLAYAATSKAARAAKLVLWDRLVARANLQQGAFTAEHMLTVVSCLRAAKFRSAISYLDVAKQRFVESGGVWTDELNLVRSRLIRACKRGLGPPSRAAPFPLWACLNQVVEEEPLTAKGPLRSLAVCIISCWWLLREIEAAAVNCADVKDTAPAAVSIFLSASKSDPDAKGVSRELVCACGQCPGAKPMVDHSLCPVCVIRSHKSFVTSKFQHLDNPPLFPTATGHTPTKAAMVQTIAAAAARLGERPHTRSGAEKWGGHAWRRGGVHFLAASGVQTIDIQLHARHSSSAILAYLDGANLAQLRGMFARFGHTEAGLIPTALPSQVCEKAAATSGPPLAVGPAPRYVVAANRLRTVHRVDSSRPQFTLCKRHCRDNPAFVPFRPATTYATCKPCWSDRKSALLGLESASPVPVTPSRKEWLRLRSTGSTRGFKQ
jgi:hypothetical protein